MESSGGKPLRTAPGPAPGSRASEQLVHADLRQGLRVDLLDDDRAIEGVRAVGRGQAARHDDRALGHAPVADLARFAVVDLRGLADEDAHGDDAAFLDDALDDLGNARR